MEMKNISMIKKMMKMRSMCIRVRCDAAASKPPSPVSVFRKGVESKRSVMLKDNYNKLLAIATADTKFLSDTLVALDAMHKEMFEKIKTKTTTSDDSEEVGVVKVADDDGDNIFKN